MTLDDAELADRRAAVEELGRALHDLVLTTVETEVAAEELRRAAAAVRAITAPLAETVRSRAQLARVDDMLGGVRMFNPVVGAGNPIAPPMVVTREDGRTVGRCTLGLAFEGPPMYTHGGISAMLLDQILGHAVIRAGRAGMTVELTCRYRKPVPLQTPLYLAAEVTGTTERTTTAVATIATEEDPGTVLVEATGTFVAIRRDLAQRLFAAAFPQLSA